MSGKTALILGATGLVGGLCLHRLLNDPVYKKVRALVRRPLVTHEKLESRVVNWDRLSGESAFFEIDHVFCCLGTTIRKAGSQAAFTKVDLTFPLEAARLAAQKNAGHFLVITAIGASPASRVFYSRIKGELEDELRKLPFRSLSIFRPSFLVGHRAETRIGEKIGIAAFRALSFLLIGRWAKYRPIHASDVALAMIEIASHERPGVTVYESDVIQTIADEIKKRDRT